MHEGVIKRFDILGKKAHDNLLLGVLRQNPDHLSKPRRVF